MPSNRSAARTSPAARSSRPAVSGLATSHPADSRLRNALGLPVHDDNVWRNQAEARRNFRDEPPATVAQAAMHMPGSSKAPKVQCSSCRLRRICVPIDLTDRQLAQVDDRLVTALRTVRRGETLFRAGDAFDAMFQIWTGFFKTVFSTRQGCEQVVGFHMGGELLGAAGINSGRHSVEAIALEDSQVCVISYDKFVALGRDVPALQTRFMGLMSREIVDHYNAMLRLGSMPAEERLAAFLLNLSDRLRVRGFSATSVVLRMSREEIGSYLGLTIETVSRKLSRFQANGLLVVWQRQIQITDPEGLQRVLEGVAVQRPANCRPERSD